MRIAPVGQQHVWAFPRPARTTVVHGDRVEQGQQLRVVAGLPAGAQHRQRAAPPIHRQVDLCAQPAPGAAQRLPLGHRYRRPGAGAPFFPGPRRMLVGPHHRRVHADRPLHRPAVVVGLRHGQDPIPGAISSPPPQPLMTGLLRPIPFRQVPPRCPGPQLPQDPVDHLAVLPPPARPHPRLRQQRRDHRPRLVRQLTATHHQPTINQPLQDRHDRPWSLVNSPRHWRRWPS